MKDCFSFRFFESDQDKKSSLVIFFSTEISLNSAVKTLRMDVEESLVPKNVYIMTMEPFTAAFLDIKKDESFNSEFDSFVGKIKDKLICLFIKSDGGIVNLDANCSVPDDLKNAILQTGMISLFKKHKGIITSSPSYHFVKPSGDHADKFIRASNLLVSSIEVTFLAISLLPYLKADLKRIYVDTSSISYLVTVAVKLCGMFSINSPSIESFESYAVFNQNYDFVEGEDSLVFISATTSGSLAKSLKQKHSFNSNQIVTLLHLNLPNDQIGIFDVLPAVEQITSKKEAECEFCKRGSKIIRISGDQFLPETPKHELLVIKKTDFNKQREQFFKEFVTKKLLGWNTTSGRQVDSREHFYIDVEKVLTTSLPNFSEKLDKAINRYISRHVNTVISLDDTGSEALSKRIRNYFGQDSENVSWLKLGEVNEERLKNTASVVVVAGAITSGRKLLAVSRDLRCIPKPASILYLVGFSKLPTIESLGQLKKDLCQGGHEFVVLRECPVPRVKENTKTAWDWEIEELTKWNDPLSGYDDELPELLTERVNFLTSEANDPHKLFLPTPDGNELKLRHTFVFWSDLGLASDHLLNTTQSDVYWTIQSVLHDLRLGSDKKGLASTYHTTLISPVCFDRYNDGVIQACLLRAAKPVELNYAVDSECSRQMTDVIYSVISNWNNPQGEATLEFLLALWTGRLRLLDIHLKELLKPLPGEILMKIPAEIRFILKQIANQNKTE
ncbi:hypothetical protein [Methylobacter sp.]|uniref:hypothetical protein n=1 Tax=Methylobacter sp. TaxID=2051955 RepID=UPI002FE01E6E